MYSDIYNFHVKYYKDKIVHTNKVLVNIQEQIAELLDVAYTYTEELNYYGISLNVNIHDIKQASTLRIKCNRILVETKQQLIFKQLLIRIYNLTLSYCSNKNKKKYFIEVKNVPFYIFKYIIKCNNTTNLNNVLNGGKWYLGTSCGNVQIKRVSRKFCNKWNEPIYTVNWGQSNKCMVELAQKQELAGQHDLYTKYKQHYITIEKLRDLLKPYVYSEETPTLPKYLIYMTDDIYYWWFWRGRNRYIKNMHLYEFVPTNFINTPDRDHTTFINKIKNIKQIINSEVIGNLNKVSMLITFDSNFKYNYEHE